MISPEMNSLLSKVFAAAVVPMIGLYVVLIRMATPSPQGGMEPTVALICYIAFTVLIGALSTVLLNFSRQLARQAKGQYTTP